ncbi:VWA domain-containing protein [Mesorhizobium sp. GR13]|uniref:vWA domain-containing protein n=1 Tax=Mesorhizobium sp. GR13 TaxID=2562308 RepID=UPI0010BFD221|nr:VWA domain-containing protein [Mesorhizobium sp. GR13]
MIQLEFTPHRSALLEGHANTIDVLLRVKAPSAQEEAKPRTPLNLSLVLDRSGSMSGKPLDEAKRCAMMVADRLTARDRLSLVAYSTEAEVLVPSTPVTDPEIFKRALRSIEALATTALHAGWQTGAEQVARHADQGILSRVLLLSDGLANQGVTDASTIARHCGVMADNGVSTSTYGLGSEFNEELMTRMAEFGAGQAHYGQTADDLREPFEEELDLMSAICARKLRLSLQPGHNVRFEVLNRYNVDESGKFILPDLAYGGEGWAVLRLTVPQDLCNPGAGAAALINARLAFEDTQGHPVETEPATLKLGPLPAAAFHAIASQEIVAARSAEVRAARIQEEARTAARVGDWAAVDRYIVELRDLSQQSEWLAASVRELERYASSRHTEHFSKEAMYKSQRMRQRLAAQSEESAAWNLRAELLQPMFLRRKQEQGRKSDNRDEK